MHTTAIVERDQMRASGDNRLGMVKVAGIKLLHQRARIDDVVVHCNYDGVGITPHCVEILGVRLEVFRPHNFQAMFAQFQQFLGQFFLL